MDRARMGVFEHEMDAVLDRYRLGRDTWLTGATLAGVAIVAWAFLLRSGEAGMGAPAFLGAWLVMMAAMMLPSAAPLVLVYRRGASATATWALTAGYLVLWGAVGIAAYAADSSLAGSRVSALVLIGAGLYELTPLKARFLRECRDPAGFLMSRWRGGAVGAFRLGLEHGLFCLGCCWALMAVLVVSAAMGLAWAAVIALAVFAEKVLPGDRIWRLAIAGALLGLGIASLLR
jgi:predicted metal-binding membrane protein